MELLVSVFCKTYNHERYLRTCLESLVSQVTDFDYEILVHDDASTDNTQDIIREYEKRYPGLIKPIYQIVNQYSQRINTTVKFLLPRARGKYIAICEGDDFWTDVYKLQKQVDFLETHPDYSLCGHAAYYADENNSLSEKEFFRPYNQSQCIPFSEILKGWRLATNSLVYRRDARGDGVIPYQHDCPNGDYAAVVYLGLKGKIYYLDELMSAYRRNSVGSLNWVWRSDPEKYKASRMKYIDMLKRIDVYTDYQYQAIIYEYIDQTMFDLYLTLGDYRGAKKDTDRYNKLQLLVKVKLIIKYYFPFLIKIVRRIKGQI